MTTDDGPALAKRRRLEVAATSSSTSTSTSSSTPTYNYPINPLSPRPSLPSAPTASIPFQKPHHLTSFSFSPTRQVLLDLDTRNESIALYREPSLGVDLNRGFEDAIWRDDSVDEGLDALLDALDTFIEEEEETGGGGGGGGGRREDTLDDLAVVTWRGMMTKLFLAIYEVESAIQKNKSSKFSGGGMEGGWEMNVMLLDGTLYFEESKTPVALRQKQEKEKSYLRQSYYGYSFEAYSTRPSPPMPSTTEPRDEPTFEPPNTNVQWCSVVKTNLGGFKMVLGGEVDCLRSDWVSTTSEEDFQTDDFVELKTNIVISSQRDEMMFERHKLLKHYTQSFLLGVPTIVVGFRTRSGQLSALQTFKTLEIPRLVQNKPHSWSPTTSINSAHSLLKFIHSTISKDPENIQRETSFRETNEPIDKDWAVWRLTFSPLGNQGIGSLELRKLNLEEVEDEVVAGKKEEVRVGFLLKRWVEGVRRRRRKGL